MENMNEKSEKKHSHRRKSPNDFAKTVVIFVCVELIIVVGAIIGVNKIACNAVHKLEAAMPKSVMDLQINPNQDTYVSLDSKELDYGSFVADIIVEKRGIEAPVYYGLNRVSLRYGAGVSIDENANAFGDNANTFIAAYDETYFKSLKYVESGDKVNVKTADKTIIYKVVDVFVGDEGDSRVKDYKNNLILYSIFSDYGENSGKCFYVVCEKTGEEVNAK